MVNWCDKCIRLFDWSELFSVLDEDDGEMEVCGDCFDNIRWENW